MGGTLHHFKSHKLFIPVKKKKVFLKYIMLVEGSDLCSA